MSDQDFMRLQQRTHQFLPPADLKTSKRFIKLCGDNDKMAETMLESHSHPRVLFPNNEQGMNYLILSKKIRTDPQVVPEHEDYDAPVDPLLFEDSAHEILMKPPENISTAIVRSEICNSLKIGNEYEEQQKDLEKNTETDLIVPDQQSAAGSGDHQYHSDSSDSFCSFRRRYESSRGSYYSGSSYDEFDEESEDFVPEVPSATSKGLKRKRMTETHQNSSDKRRRTKINEKMLVLQKLIPNCYKMDKVSVLDQAIEYLKSLQLQSQMMLMGMNLYMAPVILPMGLHQMMNPYLQFPYFSQMAMPMVIGHGNNPVNSMIPATIPPFFPFLQQFSGQSPVEHSLQWPPFPASCFPSFQDLLPKNVPEMTNKGCDT